MKKGFPTCPTAAVFSQLNWRINTKRHSSAKPAECAHLSLSRPLKRHNLASRAAREPGRDALADDFRD